MTAGRRGVALTPMEVRRVVDVTMIGIAPGMPWPRIQATLRAAAPG